MTFHAASNQIAAMQQSLLTSNRPGRQRLWLLTARDHVLARPTLSLRAVGRVTTGPLERSPSIVTRWISLLGLCAALGLSGCGQATSSSGANSASATGDTAPSGDSATNITQTEPSQTMPPEQTSRAGLPQEQTHPTIAPRRGGGLTVFTLQLTSRAQLGTHGVLMITYDVEIAGPRAAECAVKSPPSIQRGSIGERIRVVLRPGPAGWCPGEYRAAVMLERGPHCQRSQRFPAFRSERIEAGRVAWHVSKTPKPVAAVAAGG
jgi:hypothetical protein